VKIYSVGVIGAGYVSSYHLRALKNLDNVRVIGITDQDPLRAAKVAADFGVPFLESVRELYARNPEVIHVLTPPPAHCAVALEALESGCHVFVEKPLASSVEECDLMINKAVSVRRILSVNHSAKFDPAVQKALQMIKVGAIGEVQSVGYFRSSEYAPYSGGPMPLPYRDAGYPFRDIGIHALYLMETFLGEIQDIEVRPRGTGLDVHLLFDQWSALVHCQKGVGSFQLSWSSRPMQHTLSIHAHRGTIFLDLFLGTCIVSRKLPIPKALEALVNAISMASLSVGQVFWNSIRVATGRLVRGPDIHASIREFYAALSKGSPPPVSAYEGKRMVAWVEKIARAADARKSRPAAISSASKPASILVTGATGFLGTALVKALLSQGKRVRLLARRGSAEMSQPSLDVCAGDLGDPDAVDLAIRDAEIVYHVGAATHGSWADYESGTIWGTKNVVASCLRHQVRTLVYVSSLSVLSYAALRARARVDESAQLEEFPEKRGDYANSKLKAEKIVMEAVRDTKLRAVILRPGNIFGPGAERIPPYGVIPIGNHWVVIGGGDAILPLVYVSDVVDALLKSAECSQAIGRVIHLVDPEQITQREYLKYCQSKMPEIRVHYIPRSLLYCGAAGMQGLGTLARKNVPLTLYRLRSIKPYIGFDCTAARQLLEWTPRIGVRKGLEMTFLDLPVPMDQLHSLSIRNGS
jgi:predicted dehydrogenase/nucleoside-diphosphate-sugar epimerase